MTVPNSSYGIEIMSVPNKIHLPIQFQNVMSKGKGFEKIAKQNLDCC